MSLVCTLPYAAVNPVNFPGLIKDYLILNDGLIAKVHQKQKMLNVADAKRFMKHFKISTFNVGRVLVN